MVIVVATNKASVNDTVSPHNIRLTVGLIACFEKFGSLKIEWPGKDDRHNRHPPKGLPFPSLFLSAYFQKHY